MKFIKYNIYRFDLFLLPLTIHCVSTMIAVPGAPILQVQAVNSTALSVMWEHPQVLGAHLSMYKLSYYKLVDMQPPPRHPPVIVMPGTTTRHTLLRLGQYSKQPSTVSMLACNNLAPSQCKPVIT